MNRARCLLAELFGTFWLVFGGCGSAMYAAGLPGIGIGLVGVSLAFGLTVLTMAYAVGPISGGHFNPAVTVGLWVGRRFAGRSVLPYIVAQLLGGVLASASLAMIASGNSDFVLEAGALASNGVSTHSPDGYSMVAGFSAELLLTAFFVFIIMGVTRDGAVPGFAPIAIGLSLTLIHLISIPITNTSVNPARSTAPAIIEGGIAFQQLWIFWLAPILGAAVGGVTGRYMFSART